MPILKSPKARGVRKRSLSAKTGKSVIECYSDLKDAPRGPHGADGTFHGDRVEILDPAIGLNLRWDRKSARMSLLVDTGFYTGHPSPRPKSHKGPARRSRMGGPSPALET